MTKAEAGGWLKKNAAAVVTWALILLGGAVAWGVTRTEVSAHEEKLIELRADGREAKAERAGLKTDVRVIQTEIRTLSSSVSRAADAMDRLDRAVTRLEAIASTMPAAP